MDVRRVAGDEEGDAQRDEQYQETDPRGTPAAQKKRNREQQKPQLQEHESEERGDPSLRSMVANAAQRFDVTERGGDLGPEARCVEKDRRGEGEEWEHGARGGLADAFVFHPPDRGADE